MILDKKEHQEMLLEVLHSVQISGNLQQAQDTIRKLIELINEVKQAEIIEV